jgi:hypothetical protein
MESVLSSEQRQLTAHLSVGLGFVFLAAVVRHNYFLHSAVCGYFVVLADSFLRERTSAERTDNFRVAIVLIIFILIALPSAQAVESATCPVTMDGQLRALDLRLGLDGFALSRFCLAHAWAYWLTVGVYSALPLVMLLAWLKSRSFVYILSALGAAVLTFPCYFFWPAVGPQYAFIGWPGAAARLSVVDAVHPRNCMPSLHFTWAVLTALTVRGRWRLLFFAYAALMSLATVAGGEHYAVDVICALPLIFAVQCTAHRLVKR